MSSIISLGHVNTDIFAFLAAPDQHKLRCTTSKMCEWFDSAAENGSLPIFITVNSSSSETPTGGLRWKHTICCNTTSDCRQGCVMPHRAVHLFLAVTVTAHIKNYCLSTLNKPTVMKEGMDMIIDHAVVGLTADFPFEHKLVVTGLFDIRSIGNGFCKGVTASEIVFEVATDQLQAVGSDWLFGLQKLRSVTFIGFASLEEVGERWLFNCANLETVTFANELTKLRKVGGCWLSYCEKLKEVDFSGFTALEVVEDGWMVNCPSLESVNFVGKVSKLKKVGDCWMSSCRQLKHVDFSGLVALTEVKDRWLCDCANLESVTYSGEFAKLRTVGDGWMSDCPRLKDVKFSGFTALEAVGDRWMSDCPSLVSVTFPGGMPKLREVGHDWMNDCPQLKHVDFSGLSVLAKVGDRCY